MVKITDGKAELLINDFKSGAEIIDQNGRGKGRVVSIEKGICTVEFENGEIEKFENHFFYKDIVTK